jgi:hypothetical protein
VVLHRRTVWWIGGGVGAGLAAFWIYKMLTRTRPRLAAQNVPYTQAGAARGGVVVLSEAWFLSIGAPDTPDFKSFVSKTQADVERRLQAYLNGHPSVSPATTGIIVMDIEDPHLADMHTRPAAEQDAMIAAFKTRIAATRAKFPLAKIALYGTLHPDAKGRAADATYLARLASLVRAGKRGMYDGLDYLSPVLYVRFGPTDPAWGTIAAFTQLGIDGSRQLRKSSGQAIPLLPLLSLWVANGNSKHNDQIILDLPTTSPVRETWGVQFALFRQAGIRDAVIWTGEDSDLITTTANPNRRTVSQHLKALAG